jgi:hypothetical protein
MKHKMSLKLAIPLMAMSAHLMTGCGNGDASSSTAKTDTVAVADGYDDNFVVEAQSFADLQLLRYQVPGLIACHYSRKNWLITCTKQLCAAETSFMTRKARKDCYCAKHWKPYTARTQAIKTAQTGNCCRPT